MKLLGRAENKVTQDENGENVSRLEITEVVVVNCDTVNNDYQQDSRILYTLFPNKSFSLKILLFKKLLILNFHILRYGLLIKILN